MSAQDASVVPEREGDAVEGPTAVQPVGGELVKTVSGLVRNEDGSESVKEPGWATAAGGFGFAYAVPTHAQKSGDEK